MAYNPIEYWSKQDEPDRNQLIPENVRKFFCKHIPPGSDVLEYGVGRGRFIELYKDCNSVIACDITARHSFEVQQKCEAIGIDYMISISKTFPGLYDEVVTLPYVLMHCTTDEVEQIVHGVDGHRVLVVASVYKGETAEHCFNHDYFRLFPIKEYERFTVGNDNYLMFVT